MKTSEELKITKGEKVTRMQEITALATKENKRSFTDDETTEFDNLRAEVEDLNKQIERAEFLEENPAPAPDAKDEPVKKVNIKREVAPYSVGKGIREFARGGADALTGLEKEQHDELSRGITGSMGLLVPYEHQRAVNTATTHASIISAIVDPGLSILGKEPLWQKMGVTVLPGLQGTFKLNKKAADVAGKYAEDASVTAESNAPSAVTMVPERYGISDIFTKELLAQNNPAVHAAIIGDMVKACDRKITADIYTVALAAATEVAAGAITVAGFDALMAAIDADGAFAMDRGTFFEAKGVKVDTGSGKFLAALGTDNGIGLTHDGAKAFYSALFDDTAAKQFVMFGAWEEMYVGLWGALEVLINPYTYQSKGEIEITVNRLADVICRNSGAFVKSPDLEV